MKQNLEMEAIRTAIDAAHQKHCPMSLQTDTRQAHKAGYRTVSATLDFGPLDARRIDLADPPPKPVPVLKLLGQQLCTAGNVIAVTAQAKAGKSATVGGMLAAFMVAGSENTIADCLGFDAHPHNGKVVILFDTEQSRYDSHKLVLRAARRAGVDVMPANFRPYRLLDMPTKLRRAYLAAEMERANGQCGGVHCVIIDGIADLCIDPNDAAEAFGLVDELIQLAVKYDCPIIVVLHENPGQLAGGAKTRGHLGSHLERKAESNLRIVKENEVSTIYSDKCRNANLPKNKGACFQWCDVEGMHVTVTPASRAEQSQAKKADEHRLAVEAVFEGVKGAIGWTKLRSSIEQHTGAKGRTSQRRITEWLDLGLISKSATGYQKA